MPYPNAIALENCRVIVGKLVEIRGATKLRLSFQGRYLGDNPQQHSLVPNDADRASADTMPILDDILKKSGFRQNRARLYIGMQNTEVTIGPDLSSFATEIFVINSIIKRKAFGDVIKVQLNCEKNPNSTYSNGEILGWQSTDGRVTLRAPWYP